jgi:hypothetical protein
MSDDSGKAWPTPCDPPGKMPDLDACDRPQRLSLFADLLKKPIRPARGSIAV